MKKTITAIALCCIAIIMIVMQTLSLAWMSDNGMSSAIDITTNVHKTYFQSGDGSAEIIRDDEGNIIRGPYEIATPLQLYYFAWLQYLGFFNQDSNNDGYIDTTYYFRLSADLDMEGYVLPPIGTTDNPFIGNFDGEGHTINNLTVQNSYSSLIDPPDSASGFKGAEIIGCFGVVGVLDADGTGVVYDSNLKVPEVKNLILKELTVKTETEYALIGLVAGYVNGIVDTVGVVGSTVDIAAGTKPLGYTNNMSDYSLIGYCTEEFRKSVQTLNLSIVAPGSTDPYKLVPEVGGEGQQHGWGGSIAMKSIFDMIQGLDTTANANYITERVDVVSPDGKIVTVDQSGSSRDTATLKDGTIIDDETGNPFTFGSFVFTTTNYSNNEINFINGSTKVTKYEYVRDNNSSVPLYYITDGTYYLCYNNGNITSTTDRNQATAWYVENGANGGNIYVVDGDKVMYLMVGINGALVVDDVPPNLAPKWTKSGGTFATAFGNRIIYSNGAWGVSGIKIKTTSGTNYLDNNDNYSGIQNATNQNNAADWYVTIANGGYQIYTVRTNNGQPQSYYLGYNNSNNGLTLSNSSNTRATWQYENGLFYIPITTNSYMGSTTTTNYYIRYNSGWTFNRTSTAITYTPISDDSVTITTAANKTGAKITVETSQYIDNDLENYYYDESGKKVPTAGNSGDPAGITYIPLSFKYEDEEYTILASNTGYIVGSEWDETTYDSQDGQPSNLRISRYQKSSITSPDKPYIISYKNKKFTELTSNINPKDQGLVKYESCYGEYIDSLAQNCYGLHFMNAPIFKDNVVEITAYLNGRQIPNYQVPTNCIDFSLYERGFINAFAGTYYTNGGGNTSFFSLYEVIRDPDDETKIKEIKEIQSIYAALKNNEIDTSKEYIYTYTDGTSSGNIPAGYEEVFDCDWIMHTKAYCNGGGGVWTNNRSYYFEIPVNAGEYALGSTQGETGAYLVYLDLAANAQLVERDKTCEEITKSSASSTIPNGVELIDSKVEFNSTAINPFNSAFVTINNGTSGSIKYDKNGNVISHTATGGTTAEYVSVNGTLVDGEVKPMTVPWDSVTKIVRTTYRDYNFNTGVSTVTVIDEIVAEVNGVKTTKFTKDVTITYPEGHKDYPDGYVDVKPTVGPQDDRLYPETKDAADSPTVSAGTAPLIDITFSYFSDAGLTVSYLYTPGEKGEDGSVITAPKYVITILNGGTDSVEVKAVLTDLGKTCGITFVISDGTTENILTNTTEAQFISINPSATGGESGGEGGEGGQTP